MFFVVWVWYIFPESLKIAKVIPIFKTGFKTKVNNYCLISIFSNFSKIFEKLVVARLTNFVKKMFCTIISTVFARNNLIRMQCYGISINMSKNMNTGLICLDLKKVFDIVSHSILLQKLQHYGIRGNTLDLLTFYLTERKQYKIVKTGVPQGSNLALYFFQYTLMTSLIISNQPQFCTRMIHA